jgi:hypothetical protein
MAESSIEAVRAACRKLVELDDQLRQNFAPAPESFRVYNDCIDAFIAAGLPADHYKVGRDTKPLEFRSRLKAALADFCPPEAGTAEGKPQ